MSRVRTRWLPVALLLAACSDPAGLPELRLGDRLVELHRSAYSGLAEPTEAVARTEAEWDALWAELREGGAPLEAPAVDFGRSLVVVVGWGAQGTGGYVIHIDSVAARGTGHAVYVTRYRPGDRCIVTQALTHPVHAVAAPRTDGELEFVQRERAYDCE
jgi:hypothetical protein